MGEIADIVGAILYLAILYLESAGFVTGKILHVAMAVKAPAVEGLPI